MKDKLALHNILIEGCKVTVWMRATADLVGVTFLEVTPILSGLFKGFSVEGAFVFGGINPILQHRVWVARLPGIAENVI